MLRRVDGITEEDAEMRRRCAAAAAGDDLGFAPPFFAEPPRLHRRELSSCTVGIVGFGVIGSAIAARASAFGCRVIATVGRPTPPKCPPELAWLGGGGALYDLLAASDFVVLACPLNPQTAGLIGERELEAMKVQSKMRARGKRALGTPAPHARPTPHSCARVRALPTSSTSRGAKFATRPRFLRRCGEARSAPACV